MLSDFVEWLLRPQFTALDVFLAFTIGACLLAMVVSWAYMRAISYLTMLRHLLTQLQPDRNQNDKIVDQFSATLNVKQIAEQVARRAEKRKSKTVSKLPGSKPYSGGK